MRRSNSKAFRRPEPGGREVCPFTAIGFKFRASFLKSRVYAKLSKSLIAECFQAITARFIHPRRQLQSGIAYHLGKQINRCAILG